MLAKQMPRPRPFVGLAWGWPEFDTAQKLRHFHLPLKRLVRAEMVCPAPCFLWGGKLGCTDTSLTNFAATSAAAFLRSRAPSDTVNSSPDDAVADASFVQKPGCLAGLFQDHSFGAGRVPESVGSRV